MCLSGKSEIGPPSELGRIAVRNAAAPVVALAVEIDQDWPARPVSTWISTARCSLVPRRRRLKSRPPQRRDMCSQGMATIDFDEDERAALTAFLRDAIAADRFPLSPRLRPIKTVLAKLDPTPPRPALPPLKPAGEPSAIVRKMRRPGRR